MAGTEGPEATLRALLDAMCGDEFQQPAARVQSDFAPLLVPSLLALGGAPARLALLGAVEEAGELRAARRD